MTLLDIYMFAVAITGSLIYYLQAYRIVNTKSVKDISISGFATSLFTSVNWLAYGLYKGDVPLIFSGSLCTVGAVLVMLGIFYYRR